MPVPVPLKRDACPQEPDKLATDALTFYPSALVVAGIAYLSHEAAEMRGEVYAPLAGLDDAGDDVGQYQAGE
jgi:hypothetical protein